ncbi:helix-turn-helix domain-containing protein [Aliarcobacter cryaerophilus]|uniref:helix-turn-helix domain-containing protein n=1 Tax=Aliarcobacter cryaerophilus TaxID=28198 RepID=UPI003DA45735
MEINEIIDKLFDYFNVSSIQDLSQKMNVSQPTVSKWKNRNAISAVKKRCRELGIYNEIFGDLNSNGINVNTNSGQAAGTVQGNMEQSNNSNKLNNNIDEATMGLIVEAYKKALDNNSINEFRIYIMDYK